jgi:hypothetical protein
MYLKGPWTATTKAEGFDTEIETPVLKALGCAYPHAAMVRGGLHCPVCGGLAEAWR